MGKAEKFYLKNPILELLRKSLDIRQPAERRKCYIRSVWRYRKRLLEKGPDSLCDKRASHYRKLTEQGERKIVCCKLEGKHRSSRFIRDKLMLHVHIETVRRVLVRHHLDGSFRMANGYIASLRLISIR